MPFDTSHISPVWSQIVAETIQVARGEGVYLETTDGRRFLDFTSGIGVANTGHCHPRVVRAIQDQAARLIHGQINIMYHEPVARLSRELARILPPGLDSFFFANSGAEIVEGAVKLAKQATGRPNIIVFSGSFHGRTHLTMSMTTSKTVYRAGYQPLVPGIFVTPSPDASRYGWDEETTADFCIRELERLLATETAPEETAAVVVEPVLGEGGYVPPPARYLRELRALCDRHGILLVADEVQSGFGRTARWFAMEHFGVRPDITCMAKGLGSGMPISALAASKELMEAQATGSHGGTYGANAVACAAAVATIEVIREEGLLENARAIGELLVRGLREIQRDHPVIGDVRGLGVMIGTEFTLPDGSPGTSRAKAVARATFEENLLLLRCGTHSNIVRWIPPLVTTEAQAEQALETFRHALEATAAPGRGRRKMAAVDGGPSNAS